MPCVEFRSARAAQAITRRPGRDEHPSPHARASVSGVGRPLWVMGIDRSRVAKRQLRLTHPRVHDEEGNAACKHAMTDRENLMLAETLASMKPRQNGGAHWEELAVGMTQGLAKHKSPRGNWRRKKKFATHSGRVRRVDQPTRRPAYFSVTTAWLA